VSLAQGANSTMVMVMSAWIVGLRLRPTLRTRPMPYVLMLQVDVDLPFSQLQVHPFHVPRGFDPQNSSIQFSILHAGNCRTNPLKTRNSQ
jgi:hypothetical protein